jgi:hypothetical protein
MRQREGNTPLAVLLALVPGLIALGSAVRRLARGRPAVDPEDVEAGHELSNMSMGAVAASFAGLGAVLLLCFVVLSIWYADATGQPFRLAPPPSGLGNLPVGPTPPAPRLETTSGEERGRINAAEEALLSQYAWVDRERGVVRIPIDRALDLIAARGLPARSEADAAAFKDQGLTSPSSASSGRVAELTWP